MTEELKFTEKEVFDALWFSDPKNSVEATMRLNQILAEKLAKCRPYYTYEAGGDLDNWWSIRCPQSTHTARLVNSEEIKP